MKKFKFGGIEQPGIYLDETVMRMCYTHRRLMASLALNLIQEGQDEKAKEVLAKSEKAIPDYNVPHDFQSGSLDLARGYALTGQDKKAQQLIDTLWKKSSQYLTWYYSLDGMRFESSQHDCLIQLYIVEQLLQVQETIDSEKAKKMDLRIQQLTKQFHAKGGRFEY